MKKIYEKQLIKSKERVKKYQYWVKKEQEEQRVLKQKIKLF